MKHAIKLAALALGLTSIGAAHAQLYVGASVSRFDLSVDGLSSTKPSAISVKIGEQMNPNLAFEARLGKGLSSDSVNGQDLKVNTYYGIYGKGILPVTNDFSAYGLLGYSRGKVTVGPNSETDGGLSYGLGAEYMVTKNTSIGLEWARLLKGSVGGADYRVNGLSLGVGYKF